MAGIRTGIGGGVFVLVLATGIRTGIGGGYSHWHWRRGIRTGSFGRVSWFVFSASPLPANPRPHANFRKNIKIEVLQPWDYAEQIELDP